jgi:Cys-tRNA(Pro)/Cys-tRNA(Cys) deacylase
MSKSTPATVALGKAGVAFELCPYAYDPNAERIGLAAAKALGAPPEAVLKTLMVRVDGAPACVVLPSDREVSMKALAAAMKARSAEMMKPADAERLTGFKIGGVSPFGRRRATPVVIEADAMAHAKVWINGGQRGLLLKLAPEAARQALDATVAHFSI